MPSIDFHAFAIAVLRQCASFTCVNGLAQLVDHVRKHAFDHRQAFACEAQAFACEAKMVTAAICFIALPADQQVAFKNADPAQCGGRRDSRGDTGAGDRDAFAGAVLHVQVQSISRPILPAPRVISRDLFDEIVVRQAGFGGRARCVRALLYDGDRPVGQLHQRRLAHIAQDQ